MVQGFAEYCERFKPLIPGSTTAQRVAGLSLLAAPFIFALVFVLSCSKGDEKTPVLARVGDRTISGEEFRRRAELSLPPYRDTDPESVKLQLVDLLTCEKMMALEAEALALDTSRIFLATADFAGELALARELYIEEVRDKVELDEGEIEDAIEKMAQTRTVKLLPFSDRERAERYHQRLSNGESFEKIAAEIYGLAADTLSQRMTTSWGDNEPALDEAVFALKKIGQLSPVFRTSRGFAVCVLENIERDAVQTRTDYEDLKRRARTVLRARLESQRSGEFVSAFMGDKGVTLDREVFPVFAQAILGQIRFSPEKIKVNTLQMDGIDRIQQDLAPHRHRTLVRFHGGQWSVQDAIDRWRLCNLPLDIKSEQACRRSIVRNLSTMIRDKFLADEARRRGYCNRSSVKEQVGMWRDHLLYAMLKNKLSKPDLDPEFDWTGYLDRLRCKYPAKIDSGLIGEIVLNDIRLLAVRPGQYASLVVPVWPRFE